MKVNERKKYPWSFWFSIVFFVILILVSCTACRRSNTEMSDMADSDRFRNEYESLNDTRRSDGAYLLPVEIPDDNPFVYLTIQEAYDFSKTETGIVFIGAGWCRLCRLSVPVILEAYSRYPSQQEIYYVPADITYDDGEEEVYRSFTTMVRDYLKKRETSFANVTGTYSVIEDFIEQSQGEDTLLPSTILFFNKGTLIGVHVATSSSHPNSDTPMNEDEIGEFIGCFDEHMRILGTNPCPYVC